MAPEAPPPPPESPKVLATKKVELWTGRGRETATLTLTAQDLTVALEGGQKITLKNEVGDKASANLAVVPSPAMAPPPFQDHLLVTLANDRPVFGWVLVPQADNLKIALETLTDWGFAVEGHMVKVSGRRYQKDGPMYLVSELHSYNAQTGRYEPAGPLPAGLALEQFATQACVRLPVAGLPEPAAFWIVRKRTGGPDGVQVLLGEKSVVMRPADPKTAPGLVGPDPASALSAQDLDKDGTLEYILYGMAGASTWAVWVYKFDPARSGFQYLADLAGDQNLTWTAEKDGTVRFRQENRDWQNSGGKATITKDYVWRKDKFVPTP
ncbi:MAG TPA: hypothetical protein VNT75_08975 [Symbiobacteriaceae bacterium]|nr:hypothetical protein [Symbiobacteriaceae bacterium]